MHTGAGGGGVGGMGADSKHLLLGGITKVPRRLAYDLSFRETKPSMVSVHLEN